jgi:hypothetical protein
MIKMSAAVGVKVMTDVKLKLVPANPVVPKAKETIPPALVKTKGSTLVDVRHELAPQKKASK